MRLAGCMNFLFGNSIAILVISNHFQGSRLVFRIHPHQAVTFLALEVLLGGLRIAAVQFNTQIFRTFSLTLTVDKQLGRRVIRVHKYRRHLPFTSRPGPMRQDMQRTCRFVPMATIQIETILRNTRKVNDAEQGTMTWPIRIIRSRFTQIVEASPHKLTDTIR